MGDHANQPLGHSVADQLAKDVRAQEARMLPETGALTKAQRDHAARQFNDYIAERGLEPADVARQLGLSITQVIAFSEGRHGHANVDRLIRRVMRWARQHQDADGAGMGGTYITTGVAEKMLGIAKGTFDAGMMGVIVGPSGISKSTICRALEAGLIPGSVHIELTKPHGRPGALIGLIARRVESSRRTGTLASMMETLIDELKGTRRLLMFDEAHYLTRDGCQVIRDLHKQTGCPVLLVGTRDLLDTISDFSEFAGQFKRLFAYVFNITEELAETGDPLYRAEEVAKFAKSMGIRLTGGGLDYATELASLLGWGGLGSLGALLLNARAMAAAYEAKTGRPCSFDVELLRRALRNMEGASGFDRVRVRAAQRREKVAVA